MFLVCKSFTGKGSLIHLTVCWLTKDFKTQGLSEGEVSSRAPGTERVRHPVVPRVDRVKSDV